MAFIITKWTKHITDNGRDKTLNYTRPTDHIHKFRLLDDDKVIYAYGWSNNNQSFAPLDRYQNSYGCTEIQYKNLGEWETL